MLMLRFNSPSWRRTMGTLRTKITISSNWTGRVSLLSILSLLSLVTLLAILSLLSLVHRGLISWSWVRRLVPSWGRALCLVVALLRGLVKFLIILLWRRWVTLVCLAMIRQLFSISLMRVNRIVALHLLSVAGVSSSSTKEHLEHYHAHKEFKDGVDQLSLVLHSRKIEELKVPKHWIHFWSPCTFIRLALSRSSHIVELTLGLFKSISVRWRSSLLANLSPHLFKLFPNILKLSLVLDWAHSSSSTDFFECMLYLLLIGATLVLLCLRIRLSFPKGIVPLSLLDVVQDRIGLSDPLELV